MKPVGDKDTVVALDQVGHAFTGSGRKQLVVRGVNLEARAGQLTLLLGPSGSGKTTLLQIASGLIRPSAGSVSLFGQPMTRYRQRDMQHLRATRMGFVFQTFRLIESLTAAQNAALALRFAGVTGAAARGRIDAIFDRLGIGGLTDRKPSHFSQGEKQRVAIARALINEPKLVLADEPTACLESRQGREVIDILHHYAAEPGGCVLVASHDLRLAKRADMICRITDGHLSPVSEEEHRELALP